MMLSHINPLAVLLKITRNQSADSAVSQYRYHHKRSRDSTLPGYQPSSHDGSASIHTHTHKHTDAAV